MVGRSKLPFSLIRIGYISIIFLFLLFSIFGFYLVNKADHLSGQNLATELQTLIKIRNLAAEDGSTAIAFRSYLITGSVEDLNHRRDGILQFDKDSAALLSEETVHSDIREGVERLKLLRLHSELVGSEMIRLKQKGDNERKIGLLMGTKGSPSRSNVTQEVNILVNRQISYVRKSEASFLESRTKIDYRLVELALISLVLSSFLGWRFSNHLILAFQKMDFANFKLKENEAELKNAIRARDEVVGIISHELKNPLTAMSLNVKLLKKTSASLLKQNPVLDKKLTHIGSSIYRMERLALDLLDITRIEAGHIRLEMNKIDVRDILEDVIETHRALAYDKGLSLDCFIAPTCPPVLCDRDRVIQILSNLVNNAIKCTHTGQVKIIVEPLSRDDILFQVIDTGPGMAEDNLLHVFDRFWQAKEYIPFGTGLGLSITKALVEAQGGRIWITSKMNEGTRFSFTLKRVKNQRQTIAA